MCTKSKEYRTFMAYMPTSENRGCQSPPATENALTIPSSIFFDWKLSERRLPIDGDGYNNNLGGVDNQKSFYALILN